MNLIDFPKPGTKKNPLKLNLEKRPERFVEPIYQELVDKENGIFCITMYIKMTKEESMKVDDFPQLIQKFLDT